MPSVSQLIARAHHSFNGAAPFRAIGPADRQVLEVLGQRDGLTPTIIAIRTMLLTATVTKVVDRLQQAGLLERITCLEDRRRNLVCLTKRGRRIARSLLVDRRTHEAALKRYLGAVTVDDLKAYLGRVISSLENRSQTNIGRPRSRGRGALTSIHRRLRARSPTREVTFP